MPSDRTAPHAEAAGPASARPRRRRLIPGRDAADWTASHVPTKGAAMWGKRDDMIVHDEEPFNAEPPPAALAGQTLTPIEAFYSRNHGPAPDLDPAAWRLRVDGLVDRELVLSLTELQQRFAS